MPSGDDVDPHSDQKTPGNQVGAAFGTGYCDAQCPHDVKYINGEPNSQVEMTVITIKVSWGTRPGKL